MSKLPTIEETAGRLRVSKRTLREWLAKRPYDANGNSFFGRIGRTIIFREADVERIIEATRNPLFLQPKGDRTVQAAKSASTADAWIEAERLLGIEFKRPRRR